jgi:hypothetical protein
MRSLKRVFNRIRQENPFWPDYICFAEAVRGKRFSKRTISYYFNRLVSKDDYSKGEKKEILKHLFRLSNGKKSAEDCIF